MEQEPNNMDTENIEDQQSKNSFLDDNVVPKKKLSEERIIVIQKLKPEIC